MSTRAKPCHGNASQPKLPYAYDASHCDQCMFDAANLADTQWRDCLGGGATVLTPTKFISNRIPMFKRFRGTCAGARVHQPRLAVAQGPPRPIPFRV